MEIQGKFIQILPEQRGETARGQWVRQSFVIETEGEYPRKVCFIAFGEDRANMIKAIPVGTMVNVTFSLESREYPEGSGRFYTDARCIRVQPAASAGEMPAPAMGYGWAGAAPQAPTAAPAQPAAAPAATPFASAPAAGGALENDDDLPF